ncbi:envelope glycoprotein K [Cercopithecine alphaherpesvirus 2]|uniref:Envelope glycoprotein K n=1 Tax=Cercopithecine alphaherpesvirus 2 TaxID=10317 RepID=Q5Y0P8_9ALPH|nr:envelope glycoprotein K [Cercopithecine alphaherpesvirus 2]AAU88120.1 virion glycoprotein K [Cercopithecine alphaherpesvirus 2]
MLAVRSLRHLTTLCLVTAYGLVLGWYVVFGASPARRCIYAVRPVGASNDSAPAWMRVNKSLLLLSGERAPPEDPRDPAALCRGDVIGGHAVSPPPGSGLRVVVVHEAVNCLAALWDTQVRLVATSWFLYLAFVALYQRRCMFGVVSPAHKMVAPATYLLNYAGRVVSSVLLRYPYTKLTRLLCELSVQRQSLVEIFEADPVTFLYHRPAIGTAVACEILLRLASQGLIVSTAVVPWGACAIAYPMFLNIITWCFTSAILLAELYFVIRGDSAPPGPEKGPRPPKRGGLAGVCGRCCSIILSGIAVRLCYVAVVAVVVVVAFRYEQEIQRRIFDA